MSIVCNPESRTRQHREDEMDLDPSSRATQLMQDSQEFAVRPVVACLAASAKGHP